MDAEAFLAAAGELLAVPSVTDRPEDLRRALDFVLDFIEPGQHGAGFTVERFESGGKPSALLYRGARRPRFRVILNAHLDVVPAPADLFRPRRDGDRLYARGAQDSPEVARLQQAARDQGYSGDFLRKHGAGDSRFYGQYGINSVAFGVGGAGQHGPDEYADLTTVGPYRRALTGFLTDLYTT